MIFVQLGICSLAKEAYIQRQSSNVTDSIWDGHNGEKIQNLGLANEYKDSNSDIGKWLKLSIGLHFSDRKEVEDCFVDELMTDAPQDDRCTRFADYLVGNYISLNSKYPLMLWAEIPSHNMHTNNAAELFSCLF